MANEGGFPHASLVPKRETGVTAFLQKYPNFDGRNVKIAILDSGVDPGAKGLQVTSTGKPKIIDMMDATGAGDVDTSKVVFAKDNVITGITGRKLKIPVNWKNPTGEYHIGIKHAYELYPKQLRERIQKLMKIKNWTKVHKATVAGEQRTLAKFEEKNSLSMEQKLEREEIEARIDILNNLEKKYNDLGPVYDCVVFHDGGMWRAVIDTSEKGELASCNLLGPYSKTFKYATLTEHDLLNYGINVYDNGNLLEIVAMSIAHGTHVASIAAANFPDQPEKNGIAPGAQIVSVCIGDGRLGSMETGSALVRAMIKVVQSKCDIINMSYGEHSHWSGGRVMDLIHETVDIDGVIMVSSAGNNGPALTTVGTPPVMPTTSVIGVGAYVSPEMMTVDYSLREKMPATGYTWTSRGPAFDGYMGVSITAPGGAITSVPEWTLKSGQLMNGTSMSSPHVSGAVALLLSALKAKDQKYSPYSVRRSLENTASLVPNLDVFAQGHGLLQIQKAYEHHLQFGDGPERDVRFQITCSGGNRGIYLREPLSATNPADYTVNVEPVFLNESGIDGKRKVNFSMTFVLECEAPWVTTGQFLHLSYVSRSFSIRIDPRGLEFGNVYHTKVCAFDSECPEKGPVFEVSITIVKPRKIEDTVNWTMHRNEIHFKAGEIRREFIYVPEGASSCVAKIQQCTCERSSHYVLHALQLRPHCSSQTMELYKVINLNDFAENTLSFPVKGGGTLEITLAKWWASIGYVSINFSLQFSGLLPDQQSIIMHPADSIFRIDVMSSLRSEEISPQITLKNLVQTIRPAEHKIQPLGYRDIISSGRQIYELVLTYNFTVCKHYDVTPNFSLLSDMLYESEYESQLWMLHDSNKQFITAGDSHPSKYTIKLDKGDYTLRLQVRHEKKDLLDKISETQLLIQQKLNNSLSPDIYSTKAEALISGKKFSSHNLSSSSICPMYIAPLPIDKIPRNSQPGNYLLGTISYSKDEHSRKSEKYPFKYIVTDAVKKSKSSPDKNKDKTKLEEYKEAAKEFDVSWMLKLDNAGSAIYDKMKDKYKDDIQFLFGRLQALDSAKERSDNLAAILDMANQIIDAIDIPGLLSYFGIKNDLRKDASTIKSSMDKQKTVLIESLARKGSVLCDIHETSSNDDNLGQIKEMYNTLMQFVDATDSRAQVFLGKKALIEERYGNAVKFLQKQHDEKPSIESENKLIQVYKQLGWTHCVWYLERSQLVRYPATYRLF